MRGLLIGGGVLLLVMAGAASLLAQPGGGAPAAQSRDGASPLSAANEPVPAKGFIFKTLLHGDQTFKYVVYVPRSYEHGKPTPAVVFLHGSGECGQDGQKHVSVGIGSSLLKYPDRWPCIVIMPQKPEIKKQWEDYEVPVMAMLESAKHEYTIDENRIGLTGLSQGGHGVWMLAAAHPKVWCAIAPVCGYTQFKDWTGPECATPVIVPKIKGLPVWVFHGDMDDIVWPTQSTEIVEALRIANAVPVGGPMLRFTRYAGVRHNSWEKAYGEDELPKFLMTAKTVKRQ